MVVPVRRMPNADMVSCLWNLASRGFEPRHIVDVGANHAKWSREASRVFPRSSYTLIEPQKEMEPFLSRFCAGHGNRRFLIAGAGASNGQLEFTVHPNTVSSSFAYSPEERMKHGLKSRMVPLVTIDHVAKTILGAVPDIIKIDAEGFEQEVVKGSQSLLGKTEVIFLEWNFLGKPSEPNEAYNLISFMAERDYVLYDFTWFGRRKFDGALELCEAAFVRRDGYLRSLNNGEARVYVTPETPPEWQRERKAVA
jgi:FkbM family methyltransferase